MRNRQLDPASETTRPGGGPWPKRSLKLVFTLLGWIARHVRGFYSAIGLFLAIGLALILAGALLFAELAELVSEGITQRFDESVLRWVETRSSPELDVIALEVTALGSAFVLWIVVLIGSVFLWVSRHRYSAALLWIAFLGGTGLNWVLKSVFDRPRPEVFEWRTEYAGQSSFPSGHSMTAMVVYATLGYLVVRLEAGRGLRRLTLATFALVILMVGASRVYLGVHYPSDVVGGFIVGLSWATFCALGIEAVRYFRGRRPQVVEEEEELERGTMPIRDALEPHPHPHPHHPSGPSETRPLSR